MIIYSIYKSTNKINGKIYIGFDSKWPKRKFRHEKDAFNSRSSAYNDVFHKALRKYGKHNFEWEVIYISKDAEHTKNIMESFFIKKYNSHINFNNSNGYNMTLGGEGMLGFKHNTNTKNKISKTSSKLFKVWFNDELIIKSNIKHFCLERNLNYDCFKKLISGKLLSYKGYYPYANEKHFSQALINYEEKIKKSLSEMGNKHGKKYVLLSPFNERITVYNLAKFARENDLNPQSLKQLAMGRIKSNKGWRILI